MLHVHQLDPPQIRQQTSEDRLFLHLATAMRPTSEPPSGPDGTQGRGVRPKPSHLMKEIHEMTTQVETKNEAATENPELEAVMKELGEVGNTVAKGEAAKDRRFELIKKADALGASPTRIAEAAQTTRKMVYHNRTKGSERTRSTKATDK